MRTGVRDALMMAAGAAVLAAVMALVWHYRDSSEMDAAAKARRLGLVAQMKLGLARSSEAEKCAVLATTDEQARAYAEQSRDAMALVQQLRLELGDQLRDIAPANRLLAEFDAALADLRRVDEELLDLAVRSTNLEAFALAYGPAHEAVTETVEALRRVTASRGAAAASEGAIAALRLETLLAPHVAEESDEKMNALEASMAQLDAEVAKSLGDLAATRPGDADVAAAKSAWRRFAELRTRILKLSRENTNVRSLAMSLRRKRGALAVCEDKLAVLEAEIAHEPERKAPVSPR
jgi:hypothetical protein